MSPRKNRRAVSGRASPGGVSWVQETEEGPDGEWVVRAVSGAGAVKPYRCPGCDQEIPPGVAHVVAWRADDRDGRDRRHWHRPCWQARGRRSPRIMRSRGAPRY
ncbi:ATP/GTP-binding protein [Actinomadura sp. 6K520]|uniref:ATP/GTP-binding protein n=1 Tax=Actinomadura sp. 6K520 TaxID=2530364 RepID=UPI0010434279|nr:ATP/GTP-binding protein [Actinomadura sp. 6K520]TDE15171.1 ATP/GTP-binding protein [Actinomadura sp. 6K520]